MERFPIWQVLLSFHNTLHSAPGQIQIFWKSLFSKKIQIEAIMEIRDSGSSLIIHSEEKQGPLSMSSSSQAKPLPLGCRLLWCGLLSGWSCSAVSQ